MDKIKRIFIRTTLAGIAAALIMTLLTASGAGAVSWTCSGTNWWDDTTCWDTGLVPGAGENVDILNSGSSDITVDYRNSLNPTLGTLTLDGTGAGTVIVNQSQDDISTDSEYIGDNGTGVFNQTGGTNTALDLYLGYNGGSSGTYNLSGTGALLADSEFIGYDGTGVFNQDGGTNIASFLILGSSGVSNGTYNLSGDSTVQLSASAEYIGYFGDGEFNQIGGTHTATSLIVGYDSSGTYNLSGGTTTVSSYLYLGTVSGSSGAFNLSGTGALSAAFERIGNYGTGTFTQTGGMHTVANDLYLGYNSGSNGTYNLSGDSTVQLSASAEYIGYSGDGEFNQDDGMNDTTFMYLGYNSGASGTYNLSGTGALSVLHERIGYYGDGEFNQDGGTHNVIYHLFIGYNLGGIGTYNLNSGTLNVQNAEGTSDMVNNNTFNYSGGTLNADNIANNGDFNISGVGTRTVNGDITNTATGIVYVTNSTAAFTGTFMNDGAYISNSSDNYFTDLNVGSAGYLTGGAGDSFFISNDLTSSSTQNTLWNTVSAYLEFQTGADSLHDFSITGLDMGAVIAGYTDNFAWNTLALALGNSLTLLDGNATLGGALYLNEILGITLAGSSVSNVTGNGLNIYYMASLSGNAYLGGLTYDLAGGGQLIAIGGGGGPPAQVPEPSTLLLIGSGLAGLAVLRRRFMA